MFFLNPRDLSENLSPWSIRSKDDIYQFWSSLLHCCFCKEHNIVLSKAGFTFLYNWIKSFMGSFLNLHCVRGQSGFFDLVLTERNTQIKFDLRLSGYSLGVDIWLLSFKFNFGLMGWPPQPPRERVPKINKIVGFWWFIPHWETRIGHFGAMDDGNIKLRNLFCEMRLSRSFRPLRPLRLLRSLKPHIF